MVANVFQTRTSIPLSIPAPTIGAGYDYVIELEYVGEDSRLLLQYDSQNYIEIRSDGGLSIWEGGDHTLFSVADTGNLTTDGVTPINLKITRVGDTYSVYKDDVFKYSRTKTTTCQGLVNVSSVVSLNRNYILKLAFTDNNNHLNDRFYDPNLSTETLVVDTANGQDAPIALLQTDPRVVSFPAQSRTINTFSGDNFNFNLVATTEALTSSGGSSSWELSLTLLISTTIGTYIKLCTSSSNAITLTSTYVQFSASGDPTKTITIPCILDLDALANNRTKYTVRYVNKIFTLLINDAVICQQAVDVATLKAFALDNFSSNVSSGYIEEISLKCFDKPEHDFTYNTATVDSVIENSVEGSLTGSLSGFPTNRQWSTRIPSGNTFTLLDSVDVASFTTIDPTTATFNIVDSADSIVTSIEYTGSNNMKLYDFTNLGRVDFLAAGTPSQSVVGARLDHVYCDSDTGGLWVCIDATFGEQVWMKDDGTLSVNPISSPSHPDLVAMYTMDNISGSTLVDESINANNGAITGAVAVTGVIGNALSFDGVDDIATNIAQLPLTGDFALTLWVHVDTLPTSNSVIFAQYDLSGGTDPGRTLLRYQANGNLFLFLAATSLPEVTVPSGTIFVVAMRESGTVSLRYNDVAPVTAVQSGSIQDFQGTLGGQYSTFPTTGNHLNGWIDQVRIFNRALTQEEITALYNEGL